MWKWPVQAGALVVGLVLVLGGIAVVNEALRARLQDQDRYTAAFADIECEPPPGLGRAEFLGEVQYLAGLPDRLRLLDDSLAGKLAEAFAVHPWVETVRRVEVLPPRRVTVQLVWRQPALAVRVGDKLVAVDRHGVLLPRTAPTAGLPVFEGKAPSPAGPAGTRWGDPAVERAAARAARLTR